MCLKNEYLESVKKHNYIPVGLKNKNFSSEWLTDDTLINISEKNPYYGEYTFYYWYWKNILKDKRKDDWIGFCSYRELWGDKKDVADKYSTKSLLKSLPEEWKDYDAIIGEPFKLKKPGVTKVLKYGKLAVLRNFKEIFKANWSIRFQFDMFHGNGYLDEAIKMLPEKDKKDFDFYVRNESSLNQGNMFVTKSSKIIHNYFSEVFSWLEKCEKIFGFDLKGYGQTRIYAYLAERYIPFWFKKYSKCLIWPALSFNIPRKKIRN